MTETELARRDAFKETTKCVQAFKSIAEGQWETALDHGNHAECHALNRVILALDEVIAALNERAGDGQ